MYYGYAADGQAFFGLIPDIAMMGSGVKNINESLIWVVRVGTGEL